jgi:AraC-like DNA-binding protein
MKAKREAFETSKGCSFRILLNPNLNDIFFWHFHPEYEIVYVEAERGFRHIGDHISKYEISDLAFIGPNIPHLNFDYGVKTNVETIVIQMEENFLGQAFFSLPEISAIKELFENAKSGMAFHGETKLLVGNKLKQLSDLPPFEQLICLLQVFQLLAKSREKELLCVKPIGGSSVRKEQKRLQMIYQYIDSNYQKHIDINELAKLCHLSISAFCRYFRKSTHYSFTDFLNHFRINQSKKLLLQDKTVTEACYESGYDNLSYYNKTFKRITGENPSSFKKRNFIS